MSSLSAAILNFYQGHLFKDRIVFSVQTNLLYQTGIETFWFTIMRQLILESIYMIRNRHRLRTRVNQTSG